MKALKEAVAFELTTRDGRIMAWDGEEFVDVTPRKVRPHEPKVEVRRKPDRPDGKITAVYLGRGTLPGMDPKASAGDQVALEPTTFERMRRAGMTCRARELRFRCLDTQLGRDVYITRAQLGDGQLSGRFRLQDASGVRFGPEELEAAVTVIAFSTSILDAGPVSGFLLGRPTSRATDVHLIAGKICHVPRRVGLLLEAQERGTILEAGDVAVVDGVEVAATVTA